MSPFADIEAKEKGNFQKISFLDLPPGQHVVRILDNSAVRVHTHFVNKATILCLEEECPICLTNKKIYVENPNNFREIKGYSPKSKRYFVNVLDRTPVKVCPNCETENKKLPNGVFAPACSECGTVIANVDIAPSNKVKLFSFGVQVAEQLNASEQLFTDASGEPLPMNSYDIALVITGTGKEKKTNVVAMTNRNDVVEVADDKKFDPQSATITLKADEMVQLQKGISLKDIFASRKADKAEVQLQQMTTESTDEIQKRINEMFAS